MLESAIAELESGTRGYVFGSGLAASSTILELLDKDSHMIAVDDLYGGTFSSFLVLRGIRTLALRMERHISSAEKIAHWLEQQPQIEKVYYPGLASHPQHELAKRQMRGFGGMISVVLPNK
ncbi:Cys/Met metabolism PLP-dependent enzyme [Xenorhabdus koppenhoeferi]|uniref:Cys/Met metabolism PLP-dependent enzyme n=1 Tax=Xenorhabdus koppenhoeferi TaxID=351659 RepID=A0A1I7IDI1_9GAMM|nr:Cys/Met metabolism PLP-dependent enzyme [Xenorhabdus koppenhoeferi]